MIKTVVSLIFGINLLLVSACGIDGEPRQPLSKDGSPGVSVTGDARGGMVINLRAATGSAPAALSLRSAR
ncbi:MAG: hypothetical protein OXE94_13640 [Aestuariivita sp.]|nr:hypothetical protein [Aestuariivita sp.]MCY4202972.1 hypothetical protein [Aestuariivita sp.]